MVSFDYERSRRGGGTFVLGQKLQKESRCYDFIAKRHSVKTALDPYISLTYAFVFGIILGSIILLYN